MTEKKNEIQDNAKAAQEEQFAELQDLSIVANSGQDEQMSELRELTRSLLIASHAIQAQNSRNAAFQEAISDVKTATRAMMVAPAGTNPHENVKEDCGCNGCLDSDCCEFEIRLTDVRVLSMQLLEIPDSNVDPWSDLELKMFASIDGIGALIPGMFSTLNIGKLANHVGLWTQINTLVATVSVRKGQPLTKFYRVDALESDAGIGERLAGGRDEEGSGTGSVILDCCVSSPITSTVEIPFTSGGQGGGAIEVRFSATKKC
jgi:hypothetical protein